VHVVVVKDSNELTDNYADAAPQRGRRSRMVDRGVGSSPVPQTTQYDDVTSSPFYGLPLYTLDGRHAFVSPTSMGTVDNFLL
jgi:hypothetical protein